MLESNEMKAHLEGQLGGVGEFVTLKEPAGGVLEHRGRDAVNQIYDPLLQGLIWLSFQYSLLKHNAEGLNMRSTKAEH